MDALWVGVPVVTLSGDRLLSRQGESLLRNAHLDDWVATDVDGYVAHAGGVVHTAAALYHAVPAPAPVRPLPEQRR